MQDVGMVYGHWSILEPFGVLCGHLVCFGDIRYIFPVLIRCSKNNLATLVVTSPPFHPIFLLPFKIQRKKFLSLFAHAARSLAGTCL
jgi:hypothetical protein